MRLKFRAFNKATEEMYPVRGLAASDESDYLDLVDMSLTGENAVHDYSDTEYCVVMQWTGLQDKNGVDIYEGDLLKVWLVGNETEDFVVTWCQEKARFTLLDANMDKWGFTEANEFEVIGNVHEKS